MPNAFKQLMDVLAAPRQAVGDVTAVVDGLRIVRLPGGAELRARGDAAVGTRVFVRGDVIEGPAPDLPVVTLTV